MINNKLLTGILVFVLVAGLGMPVFAAPSVTGTGTETTSNFDPLSTQPLTPSTDEENQIFDNGRAGPSSLICGSTAGIIFCADDFVLDADEILTDVHFDAVDPLGTDVVSEFRYFIHADDSGLPGALIQSGDAVNEHKELIEGINYRYWFDLDIPLELPGGTTFWLAIDRVNDASGVDWLTTENPIFGNPVAFTLDGGNNWLFNSCCDMNFVLTGQERVVGGEFLPIDNTALMLAGLQSSTIWMLPTLAGFAVAGFYLIKFRTTKE